MSFTFNRAARWAGLVGLVLGTAASATTLLRWDVTELARRAPLVVRGSVVKMHSYWSGDHLAIYTDVDVAVEETLKGQTVSTVRVVQPGGEVGSIGQKVSGIAAFKSGEKVVLFLESSRLTNGYRLSGMAQGKFRVETAPDGKTLLAVPASTGDALLLDPKTRAPVSPSTAPLSLDALREIIQTAQKESAQ